MGKRKTPELAWEPEEVSPATTTPDQLNQNAQNYLNQPDGQLQGVLHSMHWASKSGQFSTNESGLSGYTVKALKDMGHDVQEMPGGSHKISWNNKMPK